MTARMQATSILLALTHHHASSADSWSRISMLFFSHSPRHAHSSLPRCPLGPCTCWLIYLASFDDVDLSFPSAFFFSPPPSPLPAALGPLYEYDQVRSTRIWVPCLYTRRSVYRGASARAGKLFMSDAPPPDLAGSLLCACCLREMADPKSPDSGRG